MTDKLCVCCGEIIPEGQQVCINCQRKAEERGRLNDHRVHREDGGCLVHKGND